MPVLSFYNRIRNTWLMYLFTTYVLGRSISFSVFLVLGDYTVINLNLPDRMWFYKEGVICYWGTRKFHKEQMQNFLLLSKCAPYYGVLISDERWAECVEHMKHTRCLQKIIIIIVECSRIRLCVLLGTTFVLSPGCHGGVALYPLSK